MRRFFGELVCFSVFLSFLIMGTGFVMRWPMIKFPSLDPNIVFISISAYLIVRFRN